jgi:signal transduction histidine kinase
VTPVPESPRTPPVQAQAPARTTRLLAALLAVTVVSSLAALGLAIPAWSHLADADAPSMLGQPLGGVWFAALGALIVRRARNVIGWLMLGSGILLSLESAANGYAIYGVLNPGTLPGPKPVGLLAEWFFAPVIAAYIATFLLFPTGRLPSRRWLPVGWLGLLTTAATVTGFAIWPRMVALPAPGGVSVTFPSPLGVRSLGPVLSWVLVGTPNGLGVAALPFFAAGVAAIVVRYRRGDRETRQQLKWIGLAFALQFAAQIAALIGLAAGPGTGARLTTIAYATSAFDALVAIPLAVTVAILRYRLYQIDIIINKAVKYGLLSVTLTAVYAAIVVGIGALAGYVGGPLLTVAAAVVIAVLFHPVRERAQRVANRLVYGQVAAPYHVLADQNVQLTAELQATIDDLTASRQRLVRAQDEERHRIERNLHDGAQQHLVALAMMLRVLEDSAGDPAEVKEMAGQLRESVRAALEDLRSLARGIYPPLLADQGLPPALRAQAARAPLPVTVEADGVGRYRRDIEATAYFCVLEALQNVAKYARASQAAVTLACPDGYLEFTVTDDGAGFDPAATARGTGLQGMADRLAAAGGTLHVTSQPGHGTTISARLPAHQLVARLPRAGDQFGPQAADGQGVAVGAGVGVQVRGERERGRQRFQQGPVLLFHRHVEGEDVGGRAVLLGVGPQHDLEQEAVLVVNRGDRLDHDVPQAVGVGDAQVAEERGVHLGDRGPHRRAGLAGAGLHRDLAAGQDAVRLTGHHVVGQLGAVGIAERSAVHERHVPGVEVVLQQVHRGAGEPVLILRDDPPPGRAVLRHRRDAGDRVVGQAHPDQAVPFPRGDHAEPALRRDG